MYSILPNHLRMCGNSTCYNLNKREKALHLKDFVHLVEPFYGRIQLYDDTRYKLGLYSTITGLLFGCVMECILKVLYLVPWSSYEPRFLSENGNILAQ